MKFEGWVPTRFDSFAWEVSERSNGHEEVLSCTKHQGFVPSLEYFGKQVFSKDTKNYKKVRRGQYAYATIHLDEGSIDCLTIRDEGIISPMYTVFEVDPERIERSFLLELLRAPAMLQRWAAIGQGTVNRRRSIGFDTLAQETILLPPLPEQKKIAAILSSVDEAIQATQAVLEQTRRVKEGLLQDLLTKGIGRDGRPHTRFKQTEIGEIPEEWALATVGGTLKRIVAGRSPTAPDQPAGGGRWGVLKVSSVGHASFHPDQNKVLPEDFEVPRAHRVSAGDVLMTRANTAALVGACCRVPKGEYRLMLCDKTLRLEPNRDQIEPDFLVEVLGAPSCRRELSSSATGSSASMKNISQEKIRSLRIGLPTLNEQRAILRVLATVNEQVSAAGCVGNELLRTRAGLLQDLLTGKVRVSV